MTIKYAVSPAREVKVLNLSQWINCGALFLVRLLQAWVTEFRKESAWVWQDVMLTVSWHLNCPDSPKKQVKTLIFNLNNRHKTMTLVGTFEFFKNKVKKESNLARQYVELIVLCHWTACIVQLEEDIDLLGNNSKYITMYLVRT